MLALSELGLILLSTALVNNFVLVQFLGLCPFLGVSKQIDSALGLSLATAFVLTLACVLSYLIDTYLLIPLDVEFLRTIAFILMVAAVVQFTERYISAVSPVLHNALGVYLPLITTNCAVLGVALLNTAREDASLATSIFYGLGTAVGFSLVLILFAAIRERLAIADVPEPFQGAAIGMITAGLMSLAFMGFSGTLAVR